MPRSSMGSSYTEGEPEGNRIPKGKTCKRIVQAVIPRVLFMVHVGFSVWRGVEASGEKKWWLLCGVILLQVAELVYVLKKRNGDEWHHFCVSILLLLCGVVPCVWLIETNRLYKGRVNIDEQEEKIKIKNLKRKNSTLAAAGIEEDVATISAQLTDTEWAIAVEQTLMCLLVIGRWALPKGQMSRKQLSQILLKYLAIGADIVELFEIFQIVEVIKDISFTYIILSAYSWSLLQFTFVILPSRYMRKRKDLSQERCTFCYSEVFEIIVSMVFLDGPFFAVRLTSILSYQANVYANYFFTVKNGLFIMLYIYSLVIITCCPEKYKEEEKYGMEEFDDLDADVKKGKAKRVRPDREKRY